MKLIPAKTPEFVKSLFPNFIWTIPNRNKELFLTFDDGPTPEVTEWVLKTLKAYEAKATFFCIGNNIIENQELFKTILLEGHQIGNHTYNHLKGWKVGTSTYLSDVKQTEAIINDIHPIKSENSTAHLKLFRPPYGKFRSSQARSIHELGYKIILWDVLSFDWDSRVSQQQCYTNVIRSAKEGSIVVFHDSVKAFKNLEVTLPKVLDYFSSRGYTFRSIY